MKKKGSIVFVIQNFSRGAGSERVTAIVADQLAKYGFDVSIISICGNNTSFYKLDSRVKLYTLISAETVNNKLLYFKVKKNYRQYLKKNKTDIVIDVFASMSMYTNVLKAEFGIKNITWEHYNYLNNSGVYKYCRKAAAIRSDFIVVLTETDKEKYINDYKNIIQKIKSIYNPSPYQNVVMDYEKREKIVLTVGRLVKLKGFHHLIDIWNIVSKKHNDWKLVIVGEGEQKENLINKIQNYKLKNIEMPGATQNIEQYYLKASICVSTSDMEGLPMMMIEAQSFGLPIVSFDYETGPKEIISEGKDGFIIKGKSQEEKNNNMAEALDKLMNDKLMRETFSVHAKKMSTRFEISSITNTWLKVIEQVLK